MSLMFGKKSATYSKKDLLYADFEDKRRSVHREAPVGFGLLRHRDDWEMLGNDRYGDCAWAGPAHEHMNWSALGGNPDVFSDETVLSDYAACTGFDPVTGANDNGTDMREGLDYRRNVGLIDVTGKRHPIGGYVALETGNWKQMLEAMYIFDAVAIGFEMPTSAMDQFNAGKAWTVVHGSSIEGGHYVPGIMRPHVYDIKVVTWAKEQMVSSGFYKKYNDEAYGIFSEESLKNGVSPEGFQMADFIEALKGI